MLHRGPGRPPNALKQNLQQLSPAQQSTSTSVLRAHLSPNFPAHLNTPNQQVNNRNLNQQANQMILSHTQQKQQFTHQKQTPTDPQGN